MARARTSPTAEESVDEAAAVEEDPAAAEEAAAEARAQQQESAMGDEYPEDADPPTQVTQGDQTAYSQARLIQDADAFLGHPSHEAAGAFYGNPNEYMTIDQAKSAIEAWLQQPVGSGEEE